MNLISRIFYMVLMINFYMVFMINLNEEENGVS